MISPSAGSRPPALNLIHNSEQKGEPVRRADLAAAVSDTVAHTLVPRVLAAARDRGRTRIAAAGAWRQTPPSGACWSGVQKGRDRALSPAPLSLRGQREHDRLSGLL